MKKIITTLGLALTTIALTSAMDMSASTTMMHGDMMKDKIIATGTMLHIESKMMMTPEMIAQDKMIMSVTIKSKINEIKKVQMILIEKGYLKTPNGKANGVYGSMTKKAIMKYKESKMTMKKEMSATDTMMHN